MIFLKIVQINAVPNGSTGKIMLSIHKELMNKGFDSYVIWGSGRKSNINNNEFDINDKYDEFFHKIYSHLLCKQGFASWNSTKKVISILENIKPDIVHLHNLHNNFINLELLFNYLKTNKIKIFWTFHDCWAFTGKCVYFDFVNCNKWKTECKNCPNLIESPTAFIDRTNWLFNKKKNLFSNLDLTIITPSDWLANFVKESFLKDYPIKVINNGINLDIFRYRNSNFKEKYNILNKKIILGVASPWSKRKGLEDFIKLSTILDKDFVIVLVGLNDKQIKNLPNNIIGIKRTNNQIELAEIYSASDVLFNPTYEDNYPTVNLEAISCGTPVLTYNTGGSTEFTKFIEHNKKLYIVDKKSVNLDFNIVNERIKKIISYNSFKLKNNKLLSEEYMVNNYINIYK